MDKSLPWKHYSSWMPPEESDALLRQALDRWPWEQGKVQLFGTWHPEPRWSFFQADPGLMYRYAGRTLVADGWLPELHALRQRIEHELGIPFNSVLVNGYRHGADYMGYHRDNEMELGPNPHVASLSLGATRDFLLRRLAPPKDRHVLSLQSGDLLWMQAPCQHAFEHALPKRLRVKTFRINLTFRQIQGRD